MFLLILKILFILTLVFVAVLMVLGYYFSRLIIKPKVVEYEKTLITEIKNNRIEESYFDMLPKREVYIESPFGYKLHGFFISSEENKRVVILNHGITYSLMGSLKFVEMYKRMGFSVLLHDLRYHGKSGGANVTFGFKEKEDIQCWVNWIFQEFKEIKTVGLHGESMGTSIGIECAAIDPRIQFLIADCGFSNWRSILEYRMMWDFKVPVFPIIYFTEFWTWIMTGARFSDVSPEKRVQTLEIPILFIHGLADKYTPHTMTEKMFQLKKGAKYLWLVPEARHINSYNLNREQYEKHVVDFLTNIGVAHNEEF